MTCYRRQDNWHSYVKNSLTAAELESMTSHLENCPECRDTVSVIQETAASFAKNRVKYCPPPAIKLNVMMSIDKNRYLVNLAHADSLTQISFTKTTTPHFFELRNWGFSMIASGILLFTLNLTSLTPNFETSQMTELQSELSQQITRPFNELSQIADNALEKIESLAFSNHSFLNKP